MHNFTLWTNPGFIGEESFRYYAYHRYWALDYISIDSNVGTKEQSEEFVVTAHKYVIRVILNHLDYASFRNIEKYNFAKLKDNYEDYYGDSEKAKFSDDEQRIDKSDVEAWERWWEPQ